MLYIAEQSKTNLDKLLQGMTQKVSLTPIYLVNF